MSAAPEGGDEGIWLAAVDNSTGDLYYFHNITGETVWELPEGVTAAGLAVPDDGVDADGEPIVTEDSRSRVFAKEGWLMKSDPSGRSWKRRWVVADRVTRTLTYYGANPRLTMAKYQVAEPVKGTISLVDARVTMNPAESGMEALRNQPNEFVFFVVTARRTLALTAASEVERTEWIQFIDRAAAGHSTRGGPPVAEAGGVVVGGDAAAEAEGVLPEPVLLDAPRNFEGWLYKSDNEAHQFNKRWCVLRAETGTLSYYEREGGGQAPKGVVDLRNATLSVGLPASAGAVASFVPAFRVTTSRSSGAREYIFQAESMDPLADWVNSVYTVIHARSDGGAAGGASGGSRPADTGVAEGHIFLEGTLYKSDPRGRSWQKRHMVLASTHEDLPRTPGVAERDLPCIAYYTDATKGSLKKTLPLTPDTEVAIGADASVKRRAPTACLLTISTPGRTLWVAAENEDDMSHWHDHVWAVVERLRAGGR